MRTEPFERRGDAQRANSTTFDDANERYARGDIDTARRLLEDRRDPHDDRTTFLYAEILIRMGDAVRAKLEIARTLPAASAKDNVRAHLLLASADLTLDDIAGAEASLEVVSANRRVGIESEEEALYRAIVAHRRGDAKAYRDQLKVASGSADPTLNARAHRLAGDVLAAEGRFAEAFDEFRLGLTALYSTRAIDDRLLAKLLVEVSFGESELETSEPISALRAIEGRDWHRVMAPHVAVALTHAGLSLTRHGRFAEAAAVYIRSTLVGGEGPNTMLALVRAHANAREAGEHANAQGFYAAALSLADRIDWRSVRADGIGTLVPLVLTLARNGNTVDAATYFATYLDLAKKGGDLRPYTSVRDLLVAHAEALLSASTPSGRDEGIRKLRQIRHELSRISFAWRAIEVRADLYAVTGQTFLLEVNRAQRRELTRAAAATEAPATPSSQKLSPQQMRIVAAVARGNATTEVALELGISARTVKNQLHKIYQKLEIDNPSREKLVAFVHANPKLGLSADFL